MSLSRAVLWLAVAEVATGLRTGSLAIRARHQGLPMTMVRGNVAKNACQTAPGLAGHQICRARQAIATLYVAT